MRKISRLFFPGLVLGPIVVTFFSGLANGGDLLYDDNWGVPQLLASGVIASFAILFLDYIWKTK